MVKYIQGFVTRIRSDEDERVVNVELTAKGRDAAERVGIYFDEIRADIPTDKIDVNLQTIIDELQALEELLDNYISRSGL